MAELNERMYSTKELKMFASKYPEVSTLSIKKIPFADQLGPGYKSQLEYAIKDYNLLANDFNNLKKKMERGNISDADNPKAIKNLQKLRNELRKVYTKKIQKLIKMAEKTKNKREIESNIKREKMETEKRIKSSMNIPPEAWEWEKRRLGRK